jgi:ribonucleoside-diphosphate reductase alpha chain
LERGSCPDAEAAGIIDRFVHKLAIAPTATISIICGNSSPGIEPYAANSFVHKTLSGSFVVRNKHLEGVIREVYPGREEEIWSSIALREGSVAHLDLLGDLRMVFRTAYEMDQSWIVQMAADRAKHICQAQSVNLFLAGNVSKEELSRLHYMAWKKGVKSLYYCRSTSIQRADKGDLGGECLGCQ